MSESACMRCGATLTGDDVGLHRKMINREASRFLCKACMAAEFQCTPAYLDRKIEQFKAAGCLLFAKTKE